MTCDQFKEVAERFFTSTTSEKIALAKHIAACPACTVLVQEASQRAMAADPSAALSALAYGHKAAMQAIEAVKHDPELGGPHAAS